MSAAVFAPYLNAREQARYELDVLRFSAREALRPRSLTTVDWWRVREEAHAPGLEIDEMDAAQLRALISAIEAIPPYRAPQPPSAPAKKKAEAKGKPFGWAEK